MLKKSDIWPLIVTLSFINTAVIGQNLRILDKETNGGIEGVFVQLIQGEKLTQFVSPESGNIEVKSPQFPVVIIARHINYETFTDTLQSLRDPVYMIPAVQQLEELVITGQYFPQSASNSLYKIRTIDAERIEEMAYVNLDQILNQELNIQISQDQATGTSSMNIMGIEGRNIKFLIDGVPVTGMVGNSTDLGQINLNNVERIEVVEGPMAVNFGTNALGGVVNIITKRPQNKGVSVSAYVHEESVGIEYGLSQGIHQQGLSGQIGITNSMSGWIDLQRNYFGGYKGVAPGRSFEWLPKTQWKGSGRLQMRRNGLTGFYKFDYLNETINSPGEPTSIFNPIALDEEFSTTRNTNTLDLTKSIRNGNINFIASRSDYKRIKTQYANNLSSGEMLLSTASGAQDTAKFRNYNLRGSVKQILSSRIAFESGFDILLDKASGGRIEGNSAKVQNDYAAYFSSEFYLGKFTLRPAARLSYNTAFGFQVTPSFNAKLELNEEWKLRFSYGRGFRSPSLRELYFEFVDSNHNVLGNTELNPEKGDHLSLNVSNNLILSTTKIESSVTGFYNNIRDQIDFGQSPTNPLVTTYINISNFESVGFALNEKFSLGNFTFNIGYNYIGRKSFFNGDQMNTDFLFSSEVVSGINYEIQSIGFSTSVMYKYTGKFAQFFYESDSLGNAIITKGVTDDYHWFDLSLNKKLGKYITLVGGVRNVFDQKRLNSTVPGTSVHTPNSRLIGYGRSYFLRINFKINSNKQYKDEN